jgi:hypothetical protein
MGIKSDDKTQINLFDVPRKGHEVWQGMPEFKSENAEPFQSIKINFRNAEDREEFARLVGQSLTDATPSIWFPKAERRDLLSLRYKSATRSENRYPIYIISKGRWESRLTSKALEAMGVPYLIAVEPQEYDQYAAVIDPAKIIVTPFSNLGLGSIPVRNFVWEHSMAAGHEWHWILDDNLRDFYRLHENVKIRVGDGVCFRIVEDFVDRYENVAIAGMNYQFFAPQSQKVPPYYLNTRVYSCILIRNDTMVADPDDPSKTVPLRWRGRYNEDTDLSLRALKAGLCTYLCNTFLANKMPTLTMKGGNMTELYQGDGRLLMAQSLVDQHPDVTTITWKWGRPQHQVNYWPFRENKLIVREGVELPSGTDDYGLELVEIPKTAAERKAAAKEKRETGARKRSTGEKKAAAVAPVQQVREVDLTDLAPEGV